MKATIAEHALELLDGTNTVGCDGVTGNSPITSGGSELGLWPRPGCWPGQVCGSGPSWIPVPGGAAVLGCSDSLQAELPEMGFQIYAERNI